MVLEVQKCSAFFQVSLNPIRILKNEAEEEKAEVARMSSFIGAIAIGDLVKSTLGPKGMDKILVSMGRSFGQVCVQSILYLLLRIVHEMLYYIKMFTESNLTLFL